MWLGVNNKTGKYKNPIILLKSNCQEIFNIYSRVVPIFLKSHYQFKCHDAKSISGWDSGQQTGRGKSQLEQEAVICKAIAQIIWCLVQGFEWLYFLL